MTGQPVVLSASPEHFASTASVADGIEAKLDWRHAERLSAERTLADECAERGVDPAAITSVHLPPGTSHPQGMSVAPGAVGRITDFTNTLLGDGVDPDWLTVHTTREFDYREQVERLATITDVGGYSLAVENLPDDCHYHTPEDIAALAVLAEELPRLDDVSVLLDTAHVPAGRRDPEVDATALDAVLERLDGPLRERMADALPAFLDANVAACDRFDPGVQPPPPGSAWRPVYATLALVGGSRVRAVHLNDPATDGLPTPDGQGDDGLRWVLAFCQAHDVAIVLEPGGADSDAIATSITELRELL